MKSSASMFLNSSSGRIENLESRSSTSSKDRQSMTLGKYEKYPISDIVIESRVKFGSKFVFSFNIALSFVSVEKKEISDD